tara:strand:- start:462 stop:746 length:285 start_codon:yes stop_codon:yes gene_type:complete
MIKQTPLERRRLSKPWLIGLAVFLLAPISSTIWGWRQRSWLLGTMPVAAAMLAAYLTPPYEYNVLIRFSHQAGAALIAYKISTEIKTSKDEKIL